MDKFVSMVFIEPILLKRLFDERSKKYNPETYMKCFEYPAIDVGLSVKSMNLWDLPLDIMRIASNITKQKPEFIEKYKDKPLQIFGMTLERGFDFLTKSFSLYKIFEDLVLDNGKMFFIHTPFYAYLNVVCDCIRYIDEAQRKRNAGTVVISKFYIGTENPIYDYLWDGYISISEYELKFGFELIDQMIKNYIKTKVFSER